MSDRSSSDRGTAGGSGSPGSSSRSVSNKIDNTSGVKFTRTEASAGKPATVYLWQHVQARRQDDQLSRDNAQLALLALCGEALHTHDVATAKHCTQVVVLLLVGVVLSEE